MRRRGIEPSKAPFPAPGRTFMMNRPTHPLVLPIALESIDQMNRSITRMKPSLSACIAILLFFGSGPATPVLLAQRVESQKDKSVTIHGVEIKKDAPNIGGNWHYQMDLINRTNETMVVDVEVRFANDEISETFEDSISLDPGQSANRDWVSKVHGTRNNTLVLYGLKKLLVRSTRQVAEQKQFEAERLNREFAQKAAADYARQQKATEEWRKQMLELAEGNRRASQLKANSAPAEPVRFNIELVKLLLLDMEGQKPRPDLGGFPKPTQNYHWALLIEAGLVDGATIKSPDGSVNSVMLKKITSQGRSFLTAVKNDKNWQQVIEKTALEGDKISSARLKEIATTLTDAGATAK